MPLTLFRSTSPITHATSAPPQWPFVQRGFMRNIEKVVNYYKLARLPIRAQHILTRLLMSITVPKSLDLERYYANVDAVALETAGALGLTSSINPGRLFKGMFYGIDSPEMIIAVDDHFDFQYVHDNWEDAVSVYPLQHPKSDLGIQYPNSRQYSPEYGLSIIVVNVPMLAVQYRAFMLEQMTKDLEFRLSLGRFLGGTVLPNMIPAQEDICFLNRIIRRYYSIENDDNIPLIKHPFVLSNYEYYMDNCIDQLISILKQGDPIFERMLQTIPSLNGGDIHSRLLTPNVMPTRQIDWLITFSRLKIYNFLIDVSGRHARAANARSLSEALRTFSLYDSYDIMQQRLPAGITQEAEAYVANIEAVTGSNIR